MCYSSTTTNDCSLCGRGSIRTILPYRVSNKILVAVLRLLLLLAVLLVRGLLGAIRYLLGGVRRFVKVID